MLKALYTVIGLGLGLLVAIISNLLLSPTPSPSVINGMAWAAAVCVLVALLLRRRVVKTLAPYKGVRVFYVQERRDTWSSHIDGYPSHFWKCQLSRFNCKLPESERRVRLLKDAADRKEVDKLALEAFGKMLDTLCAKPGAVVISSSVLNYQNRSANRLVDRECKVQERPEWQSQRICKVYNPFKSVVGRILFGWPIMPGERLWKVIAPGVVAWRRQDPVPNFERMGIVQLS